MTNEKEVGSIEGEQETLQASQMNHPSSSSSSGSSSDEKEAEATAPSGVPSAVNGTLGSKTKGSTEKREDALVLSKAVLQDNTAGKDAKGGAPATYSPATGTERGTEQTNGSPLVPVHLVGELPAPLPTASPNPDGVPGAHAVGPGFRGDLMPRIPATFETGTSVRGYRLPPADTTRSLPVPPVVEPVDDEEVGGLVQARQVDDTSGLIMHGTMEQGGDVQQAQPVEGEAEATRTAEEVNRQEEADEKRVRKIQLIIAVWFILAIILAAVIVVVQRGNADQQSKESGIDNQEDVNRTTEVTAVPTILIPESPLLDLLPNYTLDVLKMDMDLTTPQYMAYKWMLGDPNLSFDGYYLGDPNLSFDGYYSNARLLQRYALATFYYATNGDQWESQQPEILFGPAISNDTAIASSISDRNDTIAGGQGRERRLQFDPQGPPPFLAFAGFPLKGCRRRLQAPSSPAATGDFGGPQASLGFNQQEAAGGSGCGTLGEGSDWLSYDTHECQWYNQHNLTFFPGGPCDSRNGDNETFAHLYLSGNNLDGTLPPELALLTGMQHFFVESNNLRGTIPDQIYGGWQYTIQDFWTRRNGLSGTLSTHIGLWGKTLNRLNIFGNKLGGTLPDALYGMHNVKMMALIQNQFTGTIAGDLLPGLKMMRVLGFAANRFSGTVPTELGLIQNLTSFTIQSNDIGGTLPTELGVMKQLDYFDVSKNDMSGTIPSELGNAGLKYVLSLRENTRLSGSIPSEVGKLSIENLYFQRTGLEGTIPSLWCNESDTVFFDCSPGDGLCGCNCTCV